MDVKNKVFDISYCIIISLITGYAVCHFLSIKPILFIPDNTPYIFLKATVEELLCRLLMINILLSFFSMKNSLLISSLLFAFAHFNFVSGDINYYLLICHTVTGLYLGYAYLCTNSLVVPITLHFLWNIFATLLEGVTLDSQYENFIVEFSIRLTLLFLVLVYFKQPERFKGNCHGIYSIFV